MEGAKGSALTCPLHHKTINRNVSGSGQMPILAHVFSLCGVTWNDKSFFPLNFSPVFNQFLPPFRKWGTVLPVAWLGLAESIALLVAWPLNAFWNSRRMKAGGNRSGWLGWQIHEHLLSGNSLQRLWARMGIGKRA